MRRSGSNRTGNEGACSKYRGAIALADIVRPEAKPAIDALKALGVRRLMFTGDNSPLEYYQYISENLGLSPSSLNQRKNLIRIFTFAGLLLGVASIAFAGPPPGFVTYRSLTKPEQFQQLKPGDKIAYVCKECNSVSVQTIDNQEQAMELCKEGSKVTCPSCNKVYRVIKAGPISKGGQTGELKYVNDEGEECLFIVKLPADK
jgi:hypothetical protein